MAQPRFIRVVDELLTAADCKRFRSLFDTQTVEHVDRGDIRVTERILSF